MILAISISGRVINKYKSEHEVISAISSMFAEINKLDVQKRQEISK